MGRFAWLKLVFASFSQKTKTVTHHREEIEMTRAKLGLLGLCAMLFGLMAFSATAAFAEPGATWLLAKEDKAETLIPFLEAEVAIEQDEEKEKPPKYVLHTEILKIKVLFLCTGIEGINIKLKAEGKIGEGGKVKFSGCTTDLNGATASECVPKGGGGAAGTIITAPGHGLLELHILKPIEVKHDVILVLPDPIEEKTSETFATIELPVGCPIGTKVPVIGKLTLKDCQELLLLHLLKHLLEPFEPLTELWAISKTTEHKATVLGSVWAKLIKEHEGLFWSGDPK
jgi:hypothetical protein